MRVGTGIGRGSFKFGLGRRALICHIMLGGNRRKLRNRVNRGRVDMR